MLATSSWSKYQEDIFRQVKAANQNAAVNAVAGSGKSTTGVECVVIEYNKMNDTQFLAFNSHIAKELNHKFKKMNLPELAATYNSFGNRVLHNNGIKVPFDEHKTFNICSYLKIRQDYRKHIHRIVSLLKNMLLPPTLENIKKLMLDFDIEIKKELLNSFLDSCLHVATEAMQYENLICIDYDDQKYLPIVMQLQLPRFDSLFVDEFQDSCRVEIELVKRLQCRTTIFGDPWQAIYSFKGTSPDSMAEFITSFNAIELPLSICYRCSKAVVSEAQTIVPHIEAASNAVQGSVDSIATKVFREKVTDRDLVLCRTTADLVASAIWFLSKDRPAYILGKNVSDSLKDFVDNVCKHGTLNDYSALDTFIACANDYVMGKSSYYESLNLSDKAELLQDVFTAIKAIVESMNDGAVGSIYLKISSLVKEDGSAVGICHMTIHKSKGLESEPGAVTYLLRPDKLPLPKTRNLAEEMRLKYVAITRSRQGSFIYVNQ